MHPEFPYGFACTSNMFLYPRALIGTYMRANPERIPIAWGKF